MGLTAVRLAKRSEGAVLARLHLDTAIAGYGHIFPSEAPPPTIDDVVAQWEDWLGPDWERGRRAFVAEDEGRVVGVVLAGPDPVQPERGHLARLYVAVDRWGEGIGRALYDVAVARLRESGHPDATLWVLEANARARSWYERLGWVATGERKTVFAPSGIDDLRYSLDLTGGEQR